MLFVLSFVCTWIVLKLCSVCFADPCTVNAQVCDYVIDATHVCANGVGTNSAMPKEDGTRAYLETGRPCGVVWYVWGIVSYPTGETCGTSVTSNCS